MIALHRFRAVATALALIVSAPAAALAGPATEAFGQCLVGETNGNERVLLVRWMTFAFASHPAVQDAVRVDTSKVDPLNREVAQLFTDLITQRCTEPAKAAVAEAGDPGIAFSAAFEVLGGAASQEVMQAPEVSNSIAGFTAFIDETAFDELMSP